MKPLYFNGFRDIQHQMLRMVDMTFI